MNDLNQLYKIRPEYYDAWGVDNEDDAVVTLAEIFRLSYEWGKSIHFLMDQVDGPRIEDNEQLIDKYCDSDIKECEYAFLKDPESAAAHLFDGGWRSEDKEQIMEEYALTAEEVEQICKELSRFEGQAVGA